MLAAFLTTILFSISAVCGRRVTTWFGGTEANFWRLCLAAAALAAWAHTFGGGVRGAAFLLFFLSGCVGFGFGDLALFQALPRLGSRLSVMLTLCLSSPMAALMEWVWLGTPLSAAEIGCALAILGGVALALAPGHGQGAHGTALRWGVVFGAAAAFCQAAGAVMSRKAFALAAASAEDIDGITAAYQRILGGVAVSAVFLLAVRLRTAQAVSANRWRQGWPWIVANGLAGPALGVSCYQWALKTSPTGVVLPVVALTPVVIIPFARWLEGERPTRRSLAGGAVAVLGAVALAFAAQRSR
jgi:drug/metabolite transporter (DMT)-like permease